MFLYSVISIFRLWIILFNSFSCLVVFSCSSSSDFCTSSLRASTCLPVFSGILRELFMSFLSPYACSLHLFISSATYHRCLNGACPSCDPGCVRNPQSLAISVVLWFCDPVILSVWETLGLKLLLQSWNPVVTKLLRCYDPGCVTAPVSQAYSGCFGTRCGVSTQGLHRAAHTGRNLCH